MRSVWSARLLRGDGRRFHSPQSFRVLASMAQGTNDREDEGKSSSDEAALSARLGSLEHRLSEVRGNRNIRTNQSEAGSGDGSARASAMALGFRLSSELIAGVLVGGLMGWGFDRLLSTSPFGLIAFVLLGFTAGVVNVIRWAGVAQSNPRR